MRVKRINNGNSLLSENAPSWYWMKGLHDALIKSRSYHEYNAPFKNQYRNCIELLIDSDNAMFDTTVKAIKFYNCKELTPNTDIENWWWVKDSIAVKDRKITAKIELTSHKRTYIYIVRFEYCEVVRE